MAFSEFRFNENAGGKTGFGNLAFYDGTGTIAEGGDNFATIIGSNFFQHDVVEAAIERTTANRPIGGGVGLSIVIQARDKIAVDCLRIASNGDVEMRGGAWRIPNGRT